MIGSGKQPKVSIIILNWNGLEDTIECLESLQKITYPNYELIVIDNNSEGSDAEVLRGKFSGYIHLIENDKNYGFCEGNNIGIRHALKNQADYILILNNDTTVAPDFLSELVRIGESDPQIGLLGPKIYLYHEPNRIWFAGGRISLLSKSSNRGYMESDQGQFNKIDHVDVLSGSCMLIKRQVFERIGLFDPVYFFSFEDVDLSLRSTHAGFVNVFVPDSKIWHKVFRSGLRNRNIPYYTCRNAIILARKHYKFFPKVALRAPIAVTTEFIICSIRYRNVSALSIMVKGVRDGLLLNMKSA
jgi:hypothetical protein